MANVHYAQIGDVWKHLPLAEVLGIEVPRRYLESHAGSASYPLTPSAERSYGVLHFVSEAECSPVLDAACTGGSSSATDTTKSQRLTLARP